MYHKDNNIVVSTPDPTPQLTDAAADGFTSADSATRRLEPCDRTAGSMCGGGGEGGGAAISVFAPPPPPPQ